MRLASLTLERYGPFENRTIGFDPRPGVLNVLMAPNGAGKSVLRRAFGDLLFGIGGTSKMGFRFGYGGMRLHADLHGADGTSLRVVRRKGHGATLHDTEGRELAPAVLARLMGPLDQRRLGQLFALDTDRLRAGARELLETGGDLAEALLSASSGLHRARTLDRAFEGARDALAPRARRAGRPFYQALDALQEARRLGRQANLSPDAWEQHRAALGVAASRLAEAEAAAVAVGVTATRLQRLRLTRPLLARHTQAAAWLAGHPEAPVLPAALGAELVQAREALFHAEDAERRAAGVLERHEAALLQLRPDLALLDREAAVEALSGEAAQIHQIEADLAEDSRALADAERRCAGLLRELGIEAGWRDAALLLPASPLLAEAHSLLEREASFQARLVDLPDELDALRLERDALASELAVLPQVQQERDLDTLIREIREAGDPARLAATASADASLCGVEAGLSLALVPGWPGGNGLAEIGPEAASGYERRHESLARSRRALDTALAAAGSARTQLDADRAAVADLVARERAVEPREVTDARRRRDRGWDLVVGLAFPEPGGPDARAAEEARDWAGGTSLPVAYARAVDAADRLADRRVEEAASVDRLAQARLILERSERAAATAEAAAAAAHLAVAAAMAVWQRSLTPLRLDTESTAADVREFLRRREAALTAAASASLADAAMARLMAQQAQWAACLARMLGCPDAALPMLLAEAERRTAAATMSATAIASVSGQLGQVGARIARTEAALEAERGRYAAWQIDWARLLMALHRPAAETAAALRLVIDLLGRLREAIAAASALDERVGGMHRRCATFADHAVALAGLGRPELGAGRPAEVARQLATALATQRSVCAQQQQARLVRDQSRTDHGAAAEVLAAAHIAVGRVVRLSDTTPGAEELATIEAAASRIAFAEERRRQQDVLDEAETALLAAGAGLGVDVLRAEADAIAPELAEAELLAVQARQAQAIAAQSEAAAERQRLTGEMERLIGADDAALAAEQREAAVALLGRTLDEALVQHAAGLLLRQGLAELEQGGENRLVGRMGEVFSAVTGGAYAGLRVEAAEERRPARLAVLERDFPGELREIDELSEGTRDQLFLALRLAAIGEQLDHAPCPPFLADDILQTFDDRRALAAMRALLELSTRTQVIVLTHHRHLLDLLGELPEGAVHVCRLEADPGADSPAPQSEARNEP